MNLCKTCKYYGKMGNPELTANISYFDSNIPLLRKDLICKYNPKIEYKDVYDIYDGSAYSKVVSIKYHNPSISNKNCDSYKKSFLKSVVGIFK
jgi:hypothetical protein